MTYFFHNLEDPVPPPLPQVQPFATFLLSTENLIVPMTEESSLTLTAPFTMTGFIRWPEGGGAIFSVPFSGSGLASLTLNRFGQNFYVFQSITYTFTAQTPEPAALMLLCPGLLGLRLGLRRKDHSTDALSPGQDGSQPL